VSHRLLLALAPDREVADRQNAAEALMFACSNG
jgi:hypothetical protein